MQPRKPAATALATLLTACALALTMTPASSATGFSPCAATQSFMCTTVVVPLDRSQTVPGAIALEVQRLQAGPAQTQSAVLALAGGPGQAADPLATFIPSSRDRPTHRHWQCAHREGDLASTWRS